jgi:hypothetical protein
MEPLTEQRPVSGPVVYGFLRLARASAARQAALTASLAEYCDRHELQLSGVFTDRDAVAGPFSAAFTGLLDVLALPGVYGVVAPTASHIGPRAIARARGRQIESAGARLLLVRHTGPVRPTGRPRESSRHRGPGSARVLDNETSGP